MKIRYEQLNWCKKIQQQKGVKSPGDVERESLSCQGCLHGGSLMEKVGVPQGTLHSPVTPYVLPQSYLHFLNMLVHAFRIQCTHSPSLTCWLVTNTCDAQASLLLGNIS